jgi:hypothetical protein
MPAPRRRHVIRVSMHERMLIVLYRSLTESQQTVIDAAAFAGCNNKPFLHELLTAGGRHTNSAVLLPFLRAKRLIEAECGGVQ